MLISCPACPKTYQVADDAIPMEGREVECSACGTIWFEAGHLPAYLDAEFSEASGEGEDVTPLTPREAGLTLGLDTKRAASIVAAVYDQGDDRAAPEALALPAPSAPAAERVDGCEEPLIFGDEPDPVAPHDFSPFGRPSRRRGSRRTAEGETARQRRRFRARARNRLTPLRAAGWALWAGALAALSVGLTGGRDWVEAAWPKTADLYAYFEAEKAPDVTLETRSTAFAQSTHGPVIEVRGTLRNNGAQGVLPYLELVARHGESETALPVRISDVLVPARGERPFVFRAQVPEGTRGAVLRLARGEAPSDRYRYVMQTAGSGWGAPGAPSQRRVEGRGPR